MDLKSNINAFIYPGEQQGYVAECVEVAVVTQGNTLDEVVSNLQEAIALHLEGEDPVQFGLIAKPSLLIQK
jgi:predicted RNase H-like HicB family nuclease